MNRFGLNKNLLNSRTSLFRGAPLEKVRLEINRPILLQLGFRQGNQIPLLMQFVGFTDTPEISQDNRTLKIHAYDKMNVLYETKLRTGLLQENIRTDHYIIGILQECGFTSADWTENGVSLINQGLQFINFAWWGGRLASTEIKKAVEAEGGKFYVNRNGKFVFENRQFNNISIDRKTSKAYHYFDFKNIIKIDYDYDSDNLINNVVIKVAPFKRGVPETEIWFNPERILLQPGEKRTVIASYDVATDFVELQAGIDFQAFEDEAGLLANKTSDLRIVSQDPYVDRAFFVIENTGNDPIYVTKLALRATPIVQENAQLVQASDDDSVQKYGLKSIELENPYFQDTSYAQVLAESIVENYKELGSRMTIKVRARPTLQLGDAVTIKPNEFGQTYIMRVVGIKTSFSTEGLNQIIRLKEILPGELLNYFEIGVSAIFPSDELLRHVIAP